MLILTHDNKTFDLNTVGTELSESIHYGVFDYSDKQNPDYFFRPLVMTETFNNVTIEYRIGNHKIMIPQEWSVVLADPDTGDVELIPADEINVRGFHVLSFNPIRNGMHSYLPLTPIDVFTDVSWTVPRLGFHNFLVMPLENKPNPDCILIINEKDQKKLAPLDLSILI